MNYWAEWKKSKLLLNYRQNNYFQYWTAFLLIGFNQTANFKIFWF